MAFHWRIRYKLMLGLGVVVGILALLLGGTLFGLARFRATMKSIDSKQAELRKAESVRDAINNLKSVVESRQGNLVDELTQTKNAIDAYENQLNDTVNRGRDPENGFNEKGQIEAMRESLDKLKNQWLGRNTANSNLGGPGDQDIKGLMHDLVRTALDLCSAINDALNNQSQRAKETFRTTLWIVGSTGIGGVLLLCGLLRRFYVWVFFPIRDLERGAGRVAQGDFEHRIEVHSGDEMEDLAAAFNDMTGRLREMYRDLARQVNDRSRQLVRSERLAGVGFLAAGVAHEINNPLASIAFCSEALESRLADVLAQAPGNTEVVTKYLKMIQEEAFRCKKITQRLLEFSRGGDRRREPANLVDLIQGMLDMVEHLPQCKGKQVVFEPTGRLMAWVNAEEIKSVVLNLVVNALDSMDDGGILTITLGQRDLMAEMVFTDTGCGMSAEILENIFEPFYTRSRTGRGTGLGLSISHRIINQHGGELEASSAGPNQGSMFLVRLPLQPVEQMKEETFGHLAA